MTQRCNNFTFLLSYSSRNYFFFIFCFVLSNHIRKCDWINCKQYAAETVLFNTGKNRSKARSHIHYSEHVSKCFWLSSCVNDPNKHGRTKNSKTASGIFQVVQISFSELESAFPYSQVPMAKNTSSVEKYHWQYSPSGKQSPKQFLQALTACFHSATQWGIHWTRTMAMVGEI